MKRAVEVLSYDTSENEFVVIVPVEPGYEMVRYDLFTATIVDDEVNPGVMLDENGTRVACFRFQKNV